MASRPRHSVYCGWFGLSLVLGTAALAATDPARGTATPAPASAEEWFRLGAATVQHNRLEPKRVQRAKNVILFIGDGMGIATVTAARILDGQQRGGDGESNRLSFERFPYHALSVTASANQQTSDSAPTATALVTGIKTNDGAISVDQRIQRFEPSAEVTAARSARTLLERAAARGMATGVVTTTRVTHATPAVNYAHISNRDWEDDSSLPAGATVKDIARQLIEFPIGQGPDVVLGGGRSYFMPKDLARFPDPEYPTQTGRRSDGRNLIAEWQAKHPRGAYVWNRDQFAAIDPAQTRQVLGLFERSHMHYEADRSLDVAGEPSLAEMTDKAIRILQRSGKGFYLMVEGGRIDHAHHAGNAYRALTETIALAQAVQRAKELTHEQDTLIIVTADHSHVFTIAGYPSRGNPILGKTAINGETLQDSLHLPYTTLSYANGPGWTGNATRKQFQATPNNGGNETTVRAPYPGTALRPDLTHIDTTDPDYLQEALVPMSSETHGGEDVSIYASGPSAYLLRGTLEQNVVYHVMAEALGFTQ